VAVASWFSQVQVQDAFKADADQNIERLKDEMQKAAIAYTSIDRNEPGTIEEADTIQINIKGVPVDKTAALRANSYPKVLHLADGKRRLRRLPADDEQH
jgi:hypothetical protein